ncbi:L-seryl-tRNA(Sec) selenium transferase [Salibacterium salarium]|uniref:L-seryl-tRNA(Sec) selenium transferase n=1 Tax=Salibacterium salarium TaxID=284579 RepID=A0A428N323_9BACI|nr:L-seryl-tRNA(Sec) selenium transferase [Salibacterium salarium]RSL32748.1 L-seryl-tRNA(Sec) selenium transferase [Salibacterium salarium]
MKEKVRWIPPVHDFQKDIRFQTLTKETGDVSLLTKWLRNEIESLRNVLLQNNGPALHSPEELKKYILDRLEEKANSFNQDRICRVINATGTILHTNLGRSNMSEAAVEKVLLAARYYSNLEYDITTGERGSRHAILEDIIKETTGAEAAMVVNNNAAAVYFVLKALAEEKEVIVSRGQLVEIGGSFRVSSIMKESGAKLVEVGTTNKTHRYDYEEAIGEHTAMLMKVHTSNFKTVGFTKEVPLTELTHIAEKDGRPLVYEDLGSGALFDFKQYGIGDEPTVKEALATGADLVTFSGDKLLGGPQAGIIAGKKQWIDQLKKHQLARVLRVDKMTLAALEETLKAYLKGEETLQEIPVVRMVSESKQVVTERADKLLHKLKFSTWRAEIENDVSKVGGGTMPEVTLPTSIVSITTNLIPPDTVIEKLRTLFQPAIVTRAKDNKVWFDLRTVMEEEIEDIAAALMHLEKELEKNASGGKTLS